MKGQNIVDKVPEEPQKRLNAGYGKRPVWQWVVVYVIGGVIIYGLVYYFFTGGSSYS